MTSANGYLLEVQGYTLRSYWPAPFYALCLREGPDGPDEPLLIHCDSLEHARGKRGIVLDADFQEVTEKEPPASDPRPDPIVHPEYWTE